MSATTKVTYQVQMKNRQTKEWSDVLLFEVFDEEEARSELGIALTWTRKGETLRMVKRTTTDEVFK